MASDAGDQGIILPAPPLDPNAYADFNQRLQAMEQGQQQFQQQLLTLMTANRQPQPPLFVPPPPPLPPRRRDTDEVSLFAESDDFGLGVGLDRSRDFDAEEVHDAPEEKTALSNMRTLRATIFDTLGDKCPPSSSQSDFSGFQIRSGAFASLGARDELDDLRKLDTLPLAPVVRNAFKYVDFLVRDQRGILKQDVQHKTVGLVPATVRGETRATKPGGKAMKIGQYFSKEKPRIRTYRPKYYAIHEESEYLLDKEATDDADLSRMLTAPKIKVKPKPLQETEGLTRSALAILNYQEWTLNALDSTLSEDGYGRFTENEKKLFHSLSVMLEHQAQLLTRGVANCVLLRRDGALEGADISLDKELQLGLRVSPLTSCSLFGTQIESALDSQGERNKQGFKTPDAARKRSRSPLERSDFNQPSTSGQQTSFRGKKSSCSQRGRGGSSRGRGTGKPKDSGFTAPLPKTK